MTFKGAQALIYSQDKKKVLLIKRDDFPVWSLPGGRKDKGEPLEYTVVREVFEEVNIKVKVKKLLGTYKVKYFPWAGVANVYICEIVSGRPTRSTEAVEVKFFPVCCLPINILPYLRVRIRDGLEFLDK